jgi:hypothetical protein
MTSLASTAASPNSNNYHVQIPITLDNTALDIKIYRKSVFRDDFGNPLPIILSQSFTKPTLVTIITPKDPSTKISFTITTRTRARTYWTTVKDRGPDFIASKKLVAQLDSKISSLPKVNIDTLDPDDYDTSEDTSAKDIKTCKVVVLLSKSSALLARCTDRRFITPVQEKYPDVLDPNAKEEDYPDEADSILQSNPEDEKSNDDSEPSVKQSTNATAGTINDAGTKN